MATFKIKIKDTPTDKPLVIELRNLDKKLCIENQFTYDYYTADLFISKKYIAFVSWDIFDDRVDVKCPLRCIELFDAMTKFLQEDYKVHHKKSKRYNYDVEDLIKNMIDIYIVLHMKEITICKTDFCIADRLNGIVDSFDAIYEELCKKS